MPPFRSACSCACTWFFATRAERLGQGQRCACLRLTRFAELELPLDAKISASVGQQVAAATDLLATLR